MKKSVMTLVGCALFAGVSMAAEVTGNNTAVVIQKTKNESSSGYQFICIPVKGFNIAGGEAATIKLSDVLPPSEYPVGTFVKIEKSEKQLTGTYYVCNNGSANFWGTESKTEVSVDLSQTDVLWLNTRSMLAETVADGEDTNAPVIFCGEAVTAEAAKITPPSGVTAWGNATSEGKTILDLFEISNDTTSENYRKGDQVFVTQNARNDYQIYQASSTSWYMLNQDAGGGWIKVTTDNAPEIPAGEAFYYYSAKPATQDSGN